MDSDQELISNYFGGDEKSLEILIQRYLKPIFSFVCRYIGNEREAEDITQEVFVNVWRHLKKFDQRKGSFKTWLFSIAKNAAIDFLKKKRTAPFPESFADPSPLADELLEQQGIARMLESAMSRLSPKYRMVIFLRYNDHFTFREISETLGEPLNTIKSRHRRAVLMLKDYLKLSMS